MSLRVEDILVVDDSVDDLKLLQMAFRQSKAVIPLRVVDSGEGAIAYFEGRGSYADRETCPLPAMVILDLKMPRINGFDVLAHVQKMNLFFRPLIVVMSTSALPQEKEKAMALGAFAFQTKPVEFMELRKMVEWMIDSYKSSIGALPV